MSGLDDILVAEAARLDALPADQRAVELVKFSAVSPILASLNERLEKGGAISDEEIDALAKGRSGKLVNDFISYLGTAGRRTMSSIRATPKTEMPPGMKTLVGVIGGIGAVGTVRALTHEGPEDMGKPSDYRPGSVEHKMSVQHQREMRARAKDGLDAPYKAKAGAIDPATGKPHKDGRAGRDADGDGKRGE